MNYQQLRTESLLQDLEFWRRSYWVNITRAGLNPKSSDKSFWMELNWPKLSPEARMYASRAELAQQRFGNIKTLLLLSGYSVPPAVTSREYVHAVAAPMRQTRVKPDLEDILQPGRAKKYGRLQPRGHVGKRERRDKIRRKEAGLD